MNKFSAWKTTRPERLKLYKALIALVIPITIQNLLSAFVTTADVFMLTYVGQDELAAVSLANQYMFILMGFFFGINSAETIMNSQYWGRGDVKAIQAVFGIAFKICLLVTGIVSIACILIPDVLMKLYTSDSLMISIGADYLRIVGISSLFLSFSQVYMCTLRSMEKAARSTVISTVTVILNVFLNAVFIFGLFGAPKLGVLGVAIATSFARLIEFLLCLFDYIKGTCFKPDLKLLFMRHKVLMKDFTKYAGPALLNDLCWTVAFSSYSSILGHLNNDMVAASSVAATLRDLFTTLCYGIAAGGSVLIGKELGSNNISGAKRDASLICVITFITTAVLGIILIILREPMMSFFSLTDRAHDYLSIMLLISSYYIIGQAMNTLLIAGLFRAGGNAKFGLICDAITMWCVSVPLGFLTAFVFKAPPMVVYFILCLDEFWKIPVVVKYYKSGKWLNNITRENVV